MNHYEAVGLWDKAWKEKDAKAILLEIANTMWKHPGAQVISEGPGPTGRSVAFDHLDNSGALASVVADVKNDELVNLYYLAPSFDTKTAVSCPVGRTQKNDPAKASVALLLPLRKVEEMTIQKMKNEKRKETLYPVPLYAEMTSLEDVANIKEGEESDLGMQELRLCGFVHQHDIAEKESAFVASKAEKPLFLGRIPVILRNGKSKHIAPDGLFLEEFPPSETYLSGPFKEVETKVHNVTGLNFSWASVETSHNVLEIVAPESAWRHHQHFQGRVHLSARMKLKERPPVAF